MQGASKDPITERMFVASMASMTRSTVATPVRVVSGHRGSMLEGIGVGLGSGVAGVRVGAQGFATIGGHGVGGRIAVGVTLGRVLAVGGGGVDVAVGAGVRVGVVVAGTAV